MITRKDAIAIGRAITAGLVRESERHTGPDNQCRIAARGAAIYMLDNLWYDVLPPKVRESFTYSSSAFYAACGWPT